MCTEKPLALTVTVALAVAEPSALIAVSVYAVVVIGCTVMLDPVTVPIPPMLMRVAPLTVQRSVEVPPGVTVAGSATKLAISGLPD